MSGVLLYGFASGVLLATLCSNVLAADATTDTVKGRAPVVAPTITGTAAAGQTLTVKGFSDADGDAEMGSAVQWLDAGRVLTGQTAATLALNYPGVGGNLISVRVTPATDASITDPAVGTAVTSAETRVAPGAILARFVRPETPERTWSQADTYCRGLGNGARLPTLDELQQLFKDATLSTFAGDGSSGRIFNSDMCDLHGWPMNSSCGGSNNSYWTSTPDGSRHYNVSMQSGYPNAPLGSYPSQVACIR